ncbi:hypothetical protein OK016_29360 [Vibrio chagasii]|nr:hypothetical protein [Vibrio chagasii]
MKPMRVYEEMNKAFGRDTSVNCALSACHSCLPGSPSCVQPQHWINCGQAGRLVGQHLLLGVEHRGPRIADIIRYLR